MQKGFWNGEQTATFVGVEYEVTQSDGKLHWQNMHVGKRRQGIQITQGGKTWIIDNEHGDGYYKVTDGQGSPRCGHKSVFNPINVVEIPDSNILRNYDAVGIKSENEAHDAFIKETDPDEHKRLQALRETIKGFNKGG